ncbi:MAG: hypothetical protein PF795_14845 [Kiritimatiellae bacterium]|nr:hypothetical protein [Kiritimatiellia bacterium]
MGFPMDTPEGIGDSLLGRSGSIFFSGPGMSRGLLLSPFQQFPDDRDGFSRRPRGYREVQSGQDQ